MVMHLKLHKETDFKTREKIMNDRKRNIELNKINQMAILFHNLVLRNASSYPMIVLPGFSPSVKLAQSRGIRTSNQ